MYLLVFVGAIDGPTDFIVSTELTVTSRSPFLTVSPILWVLFVSLELFPPRLPVIPAVQAEIPMIIKINNTRQPPQPQNHPF